MDVRPEQRRPARRRHYHDAPVTGAGSRHQRRHRHRRRPRHVLRDPSRQLWGWGRNDEGQLGDGTTTRRLAPVRVGTSINFANVKRPAVATTGRRADDGSVWAWGSNNYGQVGDGTITDRLTPVRSTSTARPAALPRRRGRRAPLLRAAHRRHCRVLGPQLPPRAGRRHQHPADPRGQRARCAAAPNAVSLGSGRDMGNVTLADGRVKAWGHNLYGQLGDGTTTDRLSAVFVPGITNAVKAGGGGSAYGVVLVADSTTPRPTRTRSRTSPAPLHRPRLSAQRQHLHRRRHDQQLRLELRRRHTGYRGRRRGTPTARGTYTVTLTVTDNQGATDTRPRPGAPDRSTPAAQRGPRRGHHRHHLHGPHLPAERAGSTDDHDHQLRVGLRRHQDRHRCDPGTSTAPPAPTW